MSIESIRELHDMAMMHVERAEVLKFAEVPAVKRALEEQEPKIEDANTELRLALDLELQAAQLAESLNDKETRSLLMKSAAAIAFRSGQHHRALELANSLLSYAPASIAAETERMIETIEQTLDKNFIRPPKAKRPGKDPLINWHRSLPIIGGVAACGLIVSSVMSGHGPLDEVGHLVAIVAALAVVAFATRK